MYAASVCHGSQLMLKAELGCRAGFDHISQRLFGVIAYYQYIRDHFGLVWSANGCSKSQAERTVCTLNPLNTRNDENAWSYKSCGNQCLKATQWS